MTTSLPSEDNVKVIPKRGHSGLTRTRAAVYCRVSTKSDNQEDSLERVRAQQMISLTAEGPLEFEIPELTRMVLEEVCVRDRRTFDFRFLDGTQKSIRV